MNIEKLFNILETINVAGIKEIIIEKKDGQTVVRGSDSTDDEVQPSIVVTSETDHNVVDMTMGITRVPVMLNRMKLFDLSKTKVDQTANDAETYVRSVTFKESRKKVSYTFANPDTINVPSGTIDDNVNNSITLSKEYINSLIKANQAMNSTHVSISVINNDMVIELFDGISDSFTDVLSDSCVGNWSYNWMTNSVLKLLKQAIKNNDSVELGIGELGILYIEVDDLLFMVMPQVL